MWNFNKLLGLSSLEIKSYHQTNKYHIFKVKQRNKTSFCPFCGKKTSYKYGFHPQRKIQHGLIFGKICLLIFKPRRFFCQRCNKVFNEKLSFLKKYERFTQKHKKEAILNLIDRSFSSGKKHFQTSYFLQRKWLKEIVEENIFNFKEEEIKGKPFVLGIDEVSFSKHKMLTTVGNLSNHTLKGILPSMKKSCLKKILKNLSLKVKLQIKEVVIDMSVLYLKVIQETLPNAKITIDKFHVIQDANRRIDEQRLILQEIYETKIPRHILLKNKEDLKEKEKMILNMILKKYREIKIFYEVKEKIREMYGKKKKDEAETDLRLIISLLKSTDDGELISWGNTLYYFKNYILNYFDNFSTNGFMEGINNKLKLIKRISFGFKNKEVFILKAMLSVLVTYILNQPIFK